MQNEMWPQHAGKDADQDSILDFLDPDMSDTESPAWVPDEDPVDRVLSRHEAEWQRQIQEPERDECEPAKRMLKRRRKETKYGTCVACELARKPVVLQHGPNKGRAWLRCPNFYQQNAAGKRVCWRGEYFAGDESQLPKDIQTELRKWRGDVSWQLVL